MDAAGGIPWLILRLEGLPTPTAHIRRDATMPGVAARTFTGIDSDGDPWRLHVRCDAATGRHSLETEEWFPVRRLDRGKYEVQSLLGPHFIVQSDEPGAP
jgi:hypothetical protein